MGEVLETKVIVVNILKIPLRLIDLKLMDRATQIIIPIKMTMILKRLIIIKIIILKK